MDGDGGSGGGGTRGELRCAKTVGAIQPQRSVLIREQQHDSVEGVGNDVGGVDEVEQSGPSVRARGVRGTWHEGAADGGAAGAGGERGSRWRVAW